MLDISSDNEIDRWFQEQTARNLTCACGCGRQIEVKRRHYWRGLPKYHYACRANGMQNKRASITGGKYINGTQLARHLGIGMATLRRWIKAGQLPGPETSLSRMLLFDRASIDRYARSVTSSYALVDHIAR